MISLTIRLIHGVTDHFRLRAISWIMCFNMIIYGIILLNNPEVFYKTSHSVIYMNLTRLATAHTWGTMCFVLGGIRFMALFINGTFPTFRWSPYFRAASSFLSAIFWFQIVLGTLASSIYDLSSDTYITFMVLDSFSLYIAASESGTIRRVSEGG